MDFPSFTESTDFYGIVLYSLIIAAVVARFLLKPARVFTARLLKSRKYTLFCSDWRVVRFLRKNDLIRHWTIQQALIFCAYFSANLVCVFVRYPGLLEAGIRSGRLALINLIILYAGPHLGFLADAANVTMSTYHHVHSAVSFTVFALAVFHSVTASLHKQNDTFASPQLLFGLTAILSLCFQACFFPLLRLLLWYEVTLRIHHLNAGFLAYAMFRHVPSTYLLYLYASLGLFAFVSTVQSILVLYRLNFRTCRAEIVRDEDDKTTVRVYIKLPQRRAVRVEPGQYINLWMPVNADVRDGYSSVLGAVLSTRSAWQSHPFMVLSWQEEPQKELKLVIFHQEGWTRRIFNLCQPIGPPDGERRLETIALFTGPHGIPLLTDGYENILVVAQEFGMLACVPYLRKVIHEYEKAKSTVLRIHVAFEAPWWHIGRTVTDFIEDELLGSKISSAVFYATRATTEYKPKVPSNRAIGHRRKMSLDTVLATAIRERRLGSKTLVLASLTGAYWDRLKSIANGMLDKNLDIVDAVR